MENISQLVESSLVRHGVAANFDHLRLQWTSWFRCESSFSVLLAPAKPGIFALGEEIIPPAESVGARALSPPGLVDGQNRPASKRMLALFQVSEADDLGMALGRLFLPGTPLRERLTSGKCFARYAVIEDPAQRRLATEIFQRWMQESAETASGIETCGAGALARESVNKPSTSFAWGMEVQDREAEELKRPQSLPSGF
ncbi:MAG TPA: hypothetical protein VHV29_19615 [Terriglobales bacterium]|jgi:hypothetical protein|nr:hypothetical protein [Terriglobales bacterium]